MSFFGSERISLPHWPDLADAAVGDLIFYCYDCTYQNNVTRNGTGPAYCPSCKTPGGLWNSGRKGLRVWKVEAGEKERQRAAKETA